jgi:CrcB protein
VGQGRALAMVALGGLLGASARYGVGLLLPHTAGTFPLGTLLINVVGGFLIGVLIDAVAGRPLLRPFAVTGILGGFTTFSTYAVDTEQLLAAGRLALAGAYLVATLVGALAATWLGLALARRVRR